MSVCDISHTMHFSAGLFSELTSFPRRAFSGSPRVGWWTYLENLQLELSKVQLPDLTLRATGSTAGRTNETRLAGLRSARRFWRRSIDNDGERFHKHKIKRKKIIGRVQSILQIKPRSLNEKIRSCPRITWSSTLIPSISPVSFNRRVIS